MILGDLNLPNQVLGRFNQVFTGYLDQKDDPFIEEWNLFFADMAYSLQSTLAADEGHGTLSAIMM